MRAVPFVRGLLLALVVLLLSGCGYNQIQGKDEAVKAGWSEVLNQYKRRADLIPNLVATVKGYAGHEQQVLTAVTEARAKVSQITVNADDAASLAQYQAAQGELAQALGRLMMVTEAYPNLKADQQFLALQTQLEGTENRITGPRPLHPAGPGLQHLHPQVPGEPHRDVVRLQGQAQLHGGERGADPAGADRGLRAAAPAACGSACGGARDAHRQSAAADRAARAGRQCAAASAHRVTPASCDALPGHA